MAGSQRRRWSSSPWANRVGPTRLTPVRFTGWGARDRAYSTLKSATSIGVAPRPPNAVGQWMPTHRSAASRACQRRPHANSSSKSANTGAGSTFASSQARSSSRKRRDSSDRERFIDPRCSANRPGLPTDRRPACHTRPRNAPFRGTGVVRGSGQVGRDDPRRRPADPIAAAPARVPAVRRPTAVRRGAPYARHHADRRVPTADRRRAGRRRRGRPLRQRQPGDRGGARPDRRRHRRRHGPGHRGRPTGLRRHVVVHRPGVPPAVPAPAPRGHRRRAGAAAGRAGGRGGLPGHDDLPGPARRPPGRGPAVAGRLHRLLRVGARAPRHRGLRRPQPAAGGQGAGGRGGRHRPLELPVRDHHRQARPGPGHGQHHGGQAGAGHPVERHPDRPAHRRADRHPARGGQRGGLVRPPGRRATGHRSPGRPDLLHRLDRHRPADHGRRRPDPQAPLPRAGRQVGRHHPGRRRRRVQDGHARLHVPACRPGVRHADPHPGPRVALRRGRGDRRRRPWPASPTATPPTPATSWARSSTPANASGCWATSSPAWPTVPGW